jgi:hypothetical protein
MTTATLQFDQPTLFREGRFTRDAPASPSPRRDDVTAPPQPTARDVTSAPAAPNAGAPRGGPTLDEVLSATLDGLAAHHPVTCPVCQGSMVPRYGSGATPVGGRCKRCGSTLG